MLKGCRRSRPEPRRVTRGKGNRRESGQQNHQRVAEDDQEPHKPAAPSFLRNLVRAGGTRSRFGLLLRQALGSRVQRLKQCIAVFPRRFKDGSRDVNVMFLCLCGNWRSISRRRSPHGSSDALDCFGVWRRGRLLRCAIRIRCRHAFYHRHLRHLFEASLRYVLEHVADHPIIHIEKLLSCISRNYCRGTW